MAFGRPLAQKKGTSNISDLGYRYNDKCCIIAASVAANE